VCYRNPLLGDLQLQTDLGLQFQQGQLVAKGTDCKKAFLALAGALSRSHAGNEAEQQSQEAKPEEHERVVVLVDGLDEAWCVAELHVAAHFALLRFVC